MGRKYWAPLGWALRATRLTRRIVRRLISPALGSEVQARSLGKLLQALPAWVYANLERWHTLSFLRTRDVHTMLRAAERTALEPDKIAALRAVVEHDLGYRLHQAVQRVKVDLSRQEAAEFVLQTDALHLRTPVMRSDFETWIAPEFAPHGSKPGGAVALNKHSTGAGRTRVPDRRHVVGTGGAARVYQPLW